MNFADEEYARLYVTDTNTWRMLGWDGQSVLALMLRRFDRNTGVFEFGRHDPERAIVAAIGCPPETARSGLEAILAEKVWVQLATSFYWPTCVEAQTCRRSDRYRKRQQREREAKEQMSRDSISESDNGHRDVTLGHDIVTKVTASQKRDQMSQDVTLGKARQGKARPPSGLEGSSDLGGGNSDARESAPPDPPPPILPTRRERAAGDLMACPASELASKCKSDPFAASNSLVQDRSEVVEIYTAWCKAIGLTPMRINGYSDRNKPLLAILEALEAAPLERVLLACEQAQRDDWCCGRKGTDRDPARKRDIGCLSPTVLSHLLNAADARASSDAKRQANAAKLAAAEAAERAREREPRAPPPSMRDVRALVGGVAKSIQDPPTSRVETKPGPKTAEEIDRALAAIS